jgi:parallel beta-helix repeat protein
MRPGWLNIFIALLLLASGGLAPGAPQVFHADCNGHGLLSLDAALQNARQALRNGAGEVHIELAGGTYELDQPLVLTEEDSGLVIEAVPHETPVLSGRRIICGWHRSSVNPNTWETEIPEVRNGDWIFHELFVNGERRERTRLPVEGYYRANGPGVKGFPTELRFPTGAINPGWARAQDVEVVVYEAWAQTRNQIRAVFGPTHIVSLAGKAIANASEDHPRFYIENAPVALRPGQWRLNLRDGILTYWPEAGESMYTATVAAPRLYDLARIEASADRPAHDIVFRGVTFADADWRLDGGSDIDGQAAEEVPGAVQLRFAQRCAFEQCVFQRLGGYALDLGGGCQENRIVGNEMFDLGAGGIRVGEGIDDCNIHPTGGNLIGDNHIHDIGLVSAPGVGIFVLLSSGNRIAHNEVDHTFYTAISVGWSWGYGNWPCQSNIVEFNHLHDIGQGRLSDMGGVYTLGIQPGAIVRNNLIHDVNVFDYGGWGLYTDEGSSGILLENNIVYRCQSAGFHQHYGQTNILRNNIFAFNGEAQLARTRIQTGLSFTFTNNIVYFDTGKLLTGNWGDDEWMDDNIYFDTRFASGNHRTAVDFLNWQNKGHDRNSLLIDPLFVDPANDDFRLKPYSPALRFGFHPIDMDDVGPRPEWLRH